MYDAPRDASIPQNAQHPAAATRWYRIPFAAALFITVDADTCVIRRVNPPPTSDNIAADVAISCR